jgi:hypothetical protein
MWNNLHFIICFPELLPVAAGGNAPLAVHCWRSELRVSSIARQRCQLGLSLELHDTDGKRTSTRTQACNGEVAIRCEFAFLIRTTLCCSNIFVARSFRHGERKGPSGAEVPLFVEETCVSTHLRRSELKRSLQIIFSSCLFFLHVSHLFPPTWSLSWKMFAVCTKDDRSNGLWKGMRWLRARQNSPGLSVPQAVRSCLIVYSYYGCLTYCVLSGMACPQTQYSGHVVRPTRPVCWHTHRRPGRSSGFSYIAIQKDRGAGWLQ